MTRELDIMYSQLCPKCKRSLVGLNRNLILRLLETNSYRTVEKLIGIPRETLRAIRHPEYNRVKSDLVEERTSATKPNDSENGDDLGIDVTELSKRLKEVGQNGR